MLLSYQLPAQNGTADESDHYGDEYNCVKGIADPRGPLANAGNPTQNKAHQEDRPYDRKQSEQAIYDRIASKRRPLLLPASNARRNDEDAKNE